MYNHSYVNVKCELRNSNRTQQHKCVWIRLPCNPSQDWRNILYSLVKNKQRWRKPITRGKSPSRRWNKFYLLTTSSLWGEAAYTPGMAAAFSPENCLAVKAGKESMSHSKGVENQWMSQRNIKYFFLGWCLLQILGHEWEENLFQCLCPPSNVIDKRRWLRLILPNFRFLIKAPK